MRTLHGSQFGIQRGEEVTLAGCGDPLLARRPALVVLALYFARYMADSKLTPQFVEEFTEVLKHEKKIAYNEIL